MTNRNKTILIIDSVNFISLFVAFLRFNSTRRVFYLRNNRGILNHITVKMLCKYGWSFTQIQETLSPINGVSPFGELSKLLIRKIGIIREDIFAQEINAIKDISEYERKRLSACLSKYAGKEIYFAMQLYVLLHNKFPLKDKIQAVLLKKTLFSSLIDDTFRKINLTPFYYLYFSRDRLSIRENYFMDKFLLKSNLSCIKSITKVSICIFYSLLTKLTCFLPRLNKSFKKSRICVLINSPYATEMFSLLPWLTEKPSSLKEETLLLFQYSLPKSTKDVYAKKVAQLKEYSINPFRNKDVELKKIYQYFLSHFLKNLWLYRNLFGYKGIKRWSLKYLVDMILQISFFEVIFHSFGTKILWVTDVEMLQIQMATIAINRLGGISLGTTWSQQSFPEWQTQFNQYDVYFVWGERLANIRKGVNDQSTYFVKVGYPGDSMFTREFKRAQDFRDSVFKQFKVNNILTFVDEMTANDTFISSEDLFKIYNEIFSWLEEDPSNFFVIKAKNTHTIDKYPVLKERIENFYREGRLLVLYEKAAMYPVLAANVVISPYLAL